MQSDAPEFTLPLHLCGQQHAIFVSLKIGGVMPTDIFLSIEERRLAREKEAADLGAYLFLIPLIACLVSIALSVEFPAFANVFALTAM